MVAVNDLTLNQTGIIKNISHPDSGMQRRLYDMGFYIGTPIKKILISPTGDPIAYRLRGTTIALRNADAQYIDIEVTN
ncbi:hypothetical protein CBF34_04895 [Vagococcus penaei]|uniref:Ferrous iron transporter FeoA-like domain-containing protein n=1 Tax=Vagococcus penaei TaxID=633807 RepID=A0A1Q2D4S7_9ENTE|nr:FeoA family protein [Vagococcus penaei]AQP53359.1 hypothetical protein BW732_03325 [Vagococcus penaei]RSU04129.1 hypothetical protein CBF34_04895 [Vagococcus penaei]